MPSRTITGQQPRLTGQTTQDEGANDDDSQVNYQQAQQVHTSNHHNHANEGQRADVTFDQSQGS